MKRISQWIDARTPRAVAAMIFAAVVLFTWSLDTHGNSAGTGDEPHYAMIAHSIVFDGDLDLANDYADPANLVGAGGLTPEAHAIPGKDGRLRPVHDIGLPVLFAPYFAVAYRIAAASPRWMPPGLMERARLNPALVLRHLLSFAMIAISAAMAVTLFHVCRSMTHANAAAAWWTLMFALSPPLLSHSFLFFTEIPTAFVATLFYRELALPRRSTPFQVALLGAAVGFLLLLHIRNVGLVAAMIALFLWTIRNRRGGSSAAYAFLMPILIFAAVRTLLNLHLWGSAFTNPHASMAPIGGLWAVTAETATRIFGLLVDQEHGLLAYAPIYLLVLPGALSLSHLDRRSFVRLGVLIAGYLLPVLLPFVNRHGWDGGWSPAARFLVPIAPMLAVLAFGGVAQRRTVPIFVLALVALQAALDLLLWSHPKLMWNADTGTGALASFLGIARWLPSWERPSTYSIVVSVTLLALWAAASLRSRVWRCAGS
jgi:hypothetical protein